LRRYLFDASSVLKALKVRRLDALAGGCVQQLTVYEALNAIWKECLLLKAVPPDGARELARVIAEVLKHMEVLEVRGLEEEALKAALDLGLTVYDASYVLLAQKLNLTLVTEDVELKSKARDVVEVMGVGDVVGSRPDQPTSTRSQHA